eukprot:11585341-Ditylum_brightwellii.AAC.1
MTATARPHMEDVTSQAKILGYEELMVWLHSKFRPVPTWYLRHSNITDHVGAISKNNGGKCHKSTVMTATARPHMEDVTSQAKILGYEHEKPP